MATYTITSAGTGLKIVDDSGRARYLPKPAITLSPSVTYPQAQPCIELRNGSSVLLITLADTITVNGTVAGSSLLDVFSQITAILPVNSNKAEYAEVASYAAMLALVPVKVLTTVYVSYDSKQKMSDTVYLLFPSGKRMWLAAALDN